MPKISQKDVAAQQGRVLALVAEHPAGVSRRLLGAQYLARYGEKLPPRTLQRRIEELVVRQEVVAVGDGPTTAYKPLLGRDTPLSGDEKGQVPLSAQGVKVRNQIRRPMGERSPVGYDSNWLHHYQPGRTWYLPKATRGYLREKGTTAGDARPAGTFARDILGRLLIDLAWASSRLEGNTYTRLETQNLLEFGQRAEGKDVREAQMILNHKAAIEFLVSGGEYIGFNRNTIQTIHAALSENLIGDTADEGRLRERAVEITGTAYTPTAIPQVIQECFDAILGRANAIPDPFETAFFVMVHLPYLQPFVDANKRTSRLSANIPLLAGNLSPLSFVDVPEAAYVEGTLAIYEARQVALLRDVFVYAYERSCARYRVVRDSLPSPDPIRLRYRTELADAVAATIRDREPPNTQALRARAARMSIPEGEVERFADVALELLLNIHEGSAGRYHVSPGDLAAWKTAVGRREGKQPD